MRSPHILFLVAAATSARFIYVRAFSSGVALRAQRRHGGYAVRLRSAPQTGSGGDDGAPHDGAPREIACPSSRIVSIKSTNIAGMVNDGESADINVDFGPDACLVAVTGESGSGKSLLVSKAIDLVTGGKAVASMVASASDGSEVDVSSSVELTAILYEPHLSAVSANLQSFGIDPSILNTDEINSGQLHLKRTLTSTDSGRLKSVCRINGKHTSLKTLRQISAPLFTRVDVGAASAALGRPPSRLAMLDMGVPESIKRKCLQARDVYKETRKRTEKIRRDLESRVLPSSLQGNNNSGAGLDDEQIKLMEHWVDELDAFETRITRFQESMLAQYNELVSVESNANGAGSSGIMKIVHDLRKSRWAEVHDLDGEDGCLFTTLLDFREEIKAVATQLTAAHEAYQSLASLSAPNSAVVALENTRKILYSISSGDSGPLFDTIEKTHELLNNVEESLNECARSIDGSSSCLVSTLEKMAFDGCSIEEIDNLVADWNAMARKHGISPYSLPNCHMTLREELDGNVEALKLLPEAEESERIALEEYSLACKELSDARKEVGAELSQSVTNTMPSLGLEGSTFQVELRLRPGGFDRPYYGPEGVGVDIADFLLLHQQVNGNSNSTDLLDTTHGGNIEQVASSGEKSRVLLAIETALPGSIGSTCNSFSNSAENLSSQVIIETLPISVVYDEIDAHVGGRAAVTMAKLLADQSRRKDSRDQANGGCQIVAITHSASLAAIADRHIVVERGVGSTSSSLPVRTYAVDGSGRRREIARMASGDLASGEAETFADALIRDALLQKQASPS